MEKARPVVNFVEVAQLSVSSLLRQSKSAVQLRLVAAFIRSRRLLCRGCRRSPKAFSASQSAWTLELSSLTFC